MSLVDLLQSQPDLATLRGLALVFSSRLKGVLDSAQESLPTRSCVAAPVALTDGRFFLGADLLSEIGPGGLYADGFGQLPPEVFSLVEVMTMAEAIELLSINEETP